MKNLLKELGCYVREAIAAVVFFSSVGVIVLTVAALIEAKP